jgi:hypothetical protein
MALKDKFQPNRTNRGAACPCLAYGLARPTASLPGTRRRHSSHYH